MQVGQVLARIDPTEIQALVNQQRAAVAEARYRLAQGRLTIYPNLTRDLEVTGLSTMGR